jgi:hypothetical protein
MIDEVLVWLSVAAVGMALVIRKARRSAHRLRLLLAGPAGAGKTWGALEIARGLGGRCVVIDTEQGSSDIYSDLHQFDVIDLVPPFTPEAYCDAIAQAEAAGYEVIVVDSITHEWNGSGGILELKDQLAAAKYRGNSWSAWSELTPRHRKFIDAMLRSPAHVIACGRSKTETAQVDEGGRKKVVKLGMAVEQRDGLEFEFTVVLDIVHDGHYAVASKDRTRLFTGDPRPITVEHGRALAAWLEGGEPDAGPPAATAPAAATPAPPMVAKALAAVGEATTPEVLDGLAGRLAGHVKAGRVSDEWAAVVAAAIDERRDAIGSAAVAEAADG